MARLLRSLAALGLVGFVAGLGGLFLFADKVREFHPDPAARADAIVVLTGDEERISTGMRLMEAARASRMLISGVNPSTRMPTELKRYINGSEALVKCCVDLGREALNTSGNADEARQWVAAHGFRSIIVVTSAYHLPRSLAEFARVMPTTALIGYPATGGRQLRLDGWWRHRPSVRLIAAEYVKFLGAAARLALARLTDESHLAARPPKTPPYSPDAPRTAGTAR